MNHRRMLGDTYKPLNSIIKYGDDPLDIGSLTVKFRMEQDDGASVIAEATTGVTKQPTVTFTVDTTRDVIKATAHGIKKMLADGLPAQVVLASTTTIPAGLTVAIRLFPVNVTENEFQLALTANGPAIDITSTGTGTHTYYIVGSVQKTFLAADVDTAGRYRAWWSVYSGSDGSSAPVSEQGIAVEILPFGN